MSRKWSVILTVVGFAPAAPSRVTQTVGHTGCPAGGAKCPWNQGEHAGERAPGRLGGRGTHHMHGKYHVSSHTRRYTSRLSAIKNKPGGCGGVGLKYTVIHHDCLCYLNHTFKSLTLCNVKFGSFPHKLYFHHEIMKFTILGNMLGRTETSL